EQGVLYRRVVAEHDAAVGDDVLQRLAPLGGDALGVADEVLDLPLAELARALPGEAAAEALAAHDAEPGAVALDHDRFVHQHRDPGVAQHRGDLPLHIGVVVVVAEHGDDRDGQAAELVRHDPALLEGAVPGEVACEEEDVRALLDAREAGAVPPPRVGTEVHITDSRDPDRAHNSSSSSGCAVRTLTTSHSLCTVVPGAASWATSVRYLRRSAEPTLPRR